MRSHPYIQLANFFSTGVHFAIPHDGISYTNEPHVLKSLFYCMPRVAGKGLTQALVYC